jgi:hypothetical protein
MQDWLGQLNPELLNGSEEAFSLFHSATPELLQLLNS